MSGDNPLADRRQRAREAYHDYLSRVETVTGMPAVEEAIEVATRVKITPDIVAAARAGWAAPEDAGNWLTDPGPRETARLVAAFRAAGFEVIE